MASRSKYKPEVLACRDALVRALVKSGDNTQLIAQRAKRLLCWVPNQVHDRMAWLRGLLANDKHYKATVAALQAVSRGDLALHTARREGARLSALNSQR